MRGAIAKKLKITWGSGNVFLDLGFGKDEAENLKLRAELMMRIEDFYKRSDMTQAKAAKQLGLTTPRLNALLKGKIGLFSLDALVNVATRAGLQILRLEVGQRINHQAGTTDYCRTSKVPHARPTGRMGWLLQYSF